MLFSFLKALLAQSFTDQSFKYYDYVPLTENRLNDGIHRTDRAVSEASSYLRFSAVVLGI
eukprot:6173708-Pleurochrysis_carterae.AAC.1